MSNKVICYTITDSSCRKVCSVSYASYDEACKRARFYALRHKRDFKVDAITLNDSLEQALELKFYIMVYMSGTNLPILIGTAIGLFTQEHYESILKTQLNLHDYTGIAIYSQMRFVVGNTAKECYDTYCQLTGGRWDDMPDINRWTDAGEGTQFFLEPQARYMLANDSTIFKGEKDEEF